MSDGEWKSEFLEFIAAEEVAPPPRLSASVRSRISESLNPSPWIVFAKLALFVFFGGLVSLSFCPQFGLAFSEPSALMKYMMSFGMYACQLACGSIFVGGSSFAAAFVLRLEELKVLRRTRFLQFGALSALSLGGFVCSGTSMLLSLGFVWILGAVIGGVASLEMGYFLRRRMIIGTFSFKGT